MSASNNNTFISSDKLLNQKTSEKMLCGIMLNPAYATEGTPDGEFILAKSQLGISSLHYPVGQSTKVSQKGILNKANCHKIRIIYGLGHRKWDEHNHRHAEIPKVWSSRNRSIVAK